MKYERKKIGTKVNKEKVSKLKTNKTKWCLAADCGCAIECWTYAIERNCTQSSMSCDRS